MRTNSIFFKKNYTKSRILLHTTLLPTIADNMPKHGTCVNLVRSSYKYLAYQKVNIFTDKQVKEKAIGIDSIIYKKFNFYSSGKLKYKPKNKIKI